ncbi:hypothetical protein VU07_05690, partial [Desulfobulbus sp. F4]|nr:hypothetical protein [Desulfobulbus sp. F4]
LPSEDNKKTVPPLKEEPAKKRRDEEHFNTSKNRARFRTGQDVFILSRKNNFLPRKKCIVPDAPVLFDSIFFTFNMSVFCYFHKKRPPIRSVQVKFNISTKYYFLL